MTQVYGDDNSLVPVTVIEVGPCPVVQVKSVETDGYNAIQIGFGSKKPKNTPNALKKHFAKASVEPCATLKEVRIDDESASYNMGDVITAEVFVGTVKVDVIGITKGKGFQGVMKRFGFAGQPATHGHMMHRRPGSIGMRQTPGHVFKNKKMPGHMGDVQRTVQNLRVVRVVPEKNLILVKGSIPGANGTEVLVRTAKKQKKSA